MNKKKSILDLSKDQLAGKTVLLRTDLNVPLDNGRITDATRIEEALPTIKYLHDNHAKIVIITHVGRPKGEFNSELSVQPIADRLGDLLGKNIQVIANIKNHEETANTIKRMQEQDISMLENIRFNLEEEKNDKHFSQKLADLGEIFVNDAFGTAHRAHSSTFGVAEIIPAYAGLLMIKEIDNLSEIFTSAKKPFTAIVGGSKISTKIQLLESLLNKVNSLVIGGAMSYTLLKAQGIGIGKSLVEDSMIGDAKTLLEKATDLNVNIILPLDHVVATEVSPTAVPRVTETIQENDIALDVGPKTIQSISEVLENSKTIFWNGPLGLFEMEPFEKGTKALADIISKVEATTVAGGGDTLAAISKYNIKNDLTHISTGGGASMEFLKGENLPGISIIEDLV